MNKEELYKLVLSKCYRCPVKDTYKELTNPSGVYAEEFARIRDEILKSEKPKQNPSLLKRIKNLFKN